MKSDKELSITGKHKWIRELFFLLGILGALGLRLVLIFNNIDPLLARVTWYLAIISLTAFYYYRRWIEKKRRSLIIDFNLLEKINNNKMSNSDREKIATLLGSTIVSKQMINLNFLFLASVVILLVQLYLDFLIS